MADGIVIQLTDGVDASIVTKLRDIATAARDGSNAVNSLQASLNALKTSGTSITVTLNGLGNAANGAGRGLRSVGTAANSSVSEVQAASAAIRTLEGNFGTSVRAAERFLVGVLGLGPILKLAFPIFGAVALIGIFNILYENVQKLVEAFKRLTGAETDAEIAAIKAGEKILKIKPDGFITAANFARLLSGDTTTNGDVNVTNASAKLKEIQYARELADANAQVNEKGLQGLALQQQKVKDVKAEIEFAKQAKVQAQALADAYEKQLKATHGVPVIDTVSGTILPDKQLRNITDPKQIKAIEDQMRTAQEATQGFGHEVDLLNVKLIGVQKGEGLAALKDQTKEARAQMKLFVDQLALLKQHAGGVISPQQELDLLQQQRAKALPQNVPEIDTKIGIATQAIERQKLALANVTEKWQDQADAIGEYSDALKEAQQWNKVDLQMKRDGITLTDDQTSHLKDLIKYVVEHGQYQKELRTIYAEFVSPLKNYNAAIAAANKLEADGVISHGQALIAIAAAKKGYTDATQPLAEYAHGLQDQVDLLGLVGDKLTVVTELQKVQNDLRNKGRSLTQAESLQLTTFLTQLEHQKQLSKELQALWGQNAGALQKLTIQYDALTQAHKRGIITEEQYRVEGAKLSAQFADLQIQLGKATGKDIFKATIGNYIKDFQGFSQQTTTLYKNMFASIADGAADSLGRAIAFGENLGDALQNVARQALSELLSGFIKLGIQMLVTHILGQTLQASATVASAAAATATAAAWAPAAAMVSLATFGANGPAADAAIGTTAAFAQALALFGAGGFATGGPIIGPGSSTSDSIPAFLSNGEYVINARSYSANKGLVEAINRSYGTLQPVSSDSTPASGGSRLKVEVVHDGSTSIAVQQISEDRVRIIAKQEASDTVRKEAPATIAADLDNPNSKTSKAVARNHTAPRRR